VSALTGLPLAVGTFMISRFTDDEELPTISGSGALAHRPVGRAASCFVSPCSHAAAEPHPVASQEVATTSSSQERRFPGTALQHSTITTAIIRHAHV
jgi:hypothetical protein